MDTNIKNFLTELAELMTRHGATLEAVDDGRPVIEVAIDPAWDEDGRRIREYSDFILPGWAINAEDIKMIAEKEA